MNKKNMFLIYLLFLFCLAFIPEKVEALDYIEDECVSNETCMVVCSYSTTHKMGNSRNYGPRYITIYYNFNNNNWKVRWDGYIGSSDSNGNVRYTPYHKGFDPFSYVFNDASSSEHYSIYMPKKYNGKNFTCPNNAYLDFSTVKPYNEVCFDNNGTWCTEDKSNTGTDFEKASTKVYDFNDEIETYFDLWYNSEANAVTCQDIKNSPTVCGDEIVGTLLNDFETDLKNMFPLNGASTIPAFVANSPGYSDVGNLLVDKVEARANECLNSGSISDAELKQCKESAISAKNKFIDTRVNNATSDNWGDLNIGCDDIFKFDETGSVGWILNTIFNYIKIIGPILVILLSAIDFIKAVLGSDEKAMKEAQHKLIIRLVAAVALFLIPTLVQVLLGLINQVSCSLP